ncbi:hypothetical protein KC343_g16360 [Hortaea werneckii]|nr:hypothetical protein KC338_g9249 [Hortaea werneckii]KAI7139628.1 hypothetical protein KC352_g29802 [Hortaea werneckii]KAI7542879.1 hypothetical protein KC317_g16459 [Hortaea werneckii]KAI7591356.1 hypothetical protein KC346_g16325 [Hortaea werneckii]KAI7598550.1 hypothetical protein KC343_g16360 [Hortaea werneckii]
MMFQFIACITRATPYPDTVSAMSAPKAPQGHFTLLYFASATSYTRKQHDFLPAPLPVLELNDKLEKLYPGIVEKVLRSCAVTVNLDYVDLEEEASKGEKGLVIQPGDEVAIIPPVSSG